MKKRAMSLLLVLLMVVTLFPTFTLPAAAADENGTITNPDPVTDESGNLNLTKTLTPGQNGTYDITMESWATGEVKTKGVTEKIPTDFVVVVDQSGSMDTEDMATSFTNANDVYLEQVGADSELEDPIGYYYNDGQQDYRVYAKKGYMYQYYPTNHWYVGDIITYLGTSLSWFQSSSETTFNTQNQFFYKDNGVYYPLHMTVSGKIGTYYVSFYYEKDGQQVWFNRDHADIIYHNLLGEFGWGETIDPDEWGYGTIDKTVRGVYGTSEAYTYSEVNLIKKFHTGMHVNYPMYQRKFGYVGLFYRDVNGVEHAVTSNQNITEAAYCDSNGNAVTSEGGSTRVTYNLKKAATTESRISALKTALTQFAGAVAAETDDFGAVDNKVSIVGFSSSGYNNTEILTGEDLSISWNNGWQKSTADGNPTRYYGKALVGATNGTVGQPNSKITAAINAITANGGTQPEDGLDMAYKVLTNRSTTQYTIRSGENAGNKVDRNTIVIFFTDGQPGDYPFSNMYYEANEVVEKALPIKQYGADLFSIGVFGESDGNPLTYRKYQYSNNDHTKDTDALQHQYDLDYVQAFDASEYNNVSYRWQYLYRNWLTQNNATYGATANDTIFDYMSVVSSNYPDAERYMNVVSSSNGAADTTGYSSYLEMCNAVRHTNTAEDTNKYYRMASNQDTLVAAFLQAVTMNNEETTTDTSVLLTDTAFFRDKVNTADFDTTGATYTVKYQPVVMTANGLQNDSSRTVTTAVNGAAYPADGINYSGFNYSGNFVTTAHPGQKLVITINGLTPKKATGLLKSNDGNAGVYGPEDDDPTVSIASPTLQFSDSAAHTYVIDFNAKMKVATDVTKLNGATENVLQGENGKFVKSATDVTYQLDTANQLSAKGTTVQINKAYSTVDTATVYGKLVNVAGDQTGWKQITTIPAGSVYYDDNLTNANAVTVGDGSGYNAQISASSPTAVNTEKGVYTFTFYGTGIDVYCTTDTTGGYVSAKLTQNGQAVAGQPNQTIRNYDKEVTRYNVPSISFTGLPIGEYTLTLQVLGSSNYKLDGIRVYNPADPSTYKGQDTHEQYAAYINMREALVNDNGVSQAFTGNMTETVLGALFVDDSSKLTEQRQQYDAQTHEPIVDENNNPVYGSAYKDLFEAYQNNSPKHEIYLDSTKQQEIIFKLTSNGVNAAANGNLWIGLSAPDATANGGTVQYKEGVTQDVTNAVDMYYPITENMITVNQDGTGNVSIKNTGTTMISVTNLKITGNVAIYNAAIAPKASNNTDDAQANSVEDAIPLVFEPLTMQAVKVAANNGVDPDASADPGTGDPVDPGTPDQPDDPGTDKPTWTDPVSLLKTLFQSLLNTLGNLFKGLGGW